MKTFKSYGHIHVAPTFRCKPHKSYRFTQTLTTIVRAQHGSFLGMNERLGVSVQTVWARRMDVLRTFVSSVEKLDKYSNG